MNGNRTIAFPEDDSYGFAGTIQTNSYDEATGENAITQEAARRLWGRACSAVTEVFGETDPQIIEDFLRSACGRHLADETYDKAGGKRDEAALGEAIVKALSRKKQVRLPLGGYAEHLVWKKPFENIRRAARAN